MNSKIKVISLFLMLFISFGAGNQVPVKIQATKYITAPFVTDGQRYMTQISENETAEFHVVFYKNTIYRVASSFGNEDNNVIFTVYDENQNELFSNADFDNSPYWDFQFESTVRCVIEARVAGEVDEVNPKSGFMSLQIGFKGE